MNKNNRFNLCNECEMEETMGRDKNNDDREEEESVTSVNNEIYFYTGVNRKSILELNKEIKRIGVFSQQMAIDMDIPVQNIILHINSPGGSAVNGILAYDVIKQSKVPIHTIVEGEACSAATIISVAGQKRTMYRNSVMLIHQLSTQFWGTYVNLEDEMKNCELLMNKIFGIYLNNTKIPKKILSEVLKHDLYFDAETCLKYRLVDGII